MNMCLMLSCEIVKELENLKNDLVQLQRLMEQRHLSERDSKLMIGAQMNMDKKVTNHLKVRYQSRHCCWFSFSCNWTRRSQIF